MLINTTVPRVVPPATPRSDSRTGDPQASAQAGVLQARYAALAATPEVLAKALTGRCLNQLPAEQQAKLLAFSKALKDGAMAWPEWRVVQHSAGGPSAGVGDALFKGAMAAFVPGKVGDGGTALLAHGLTGPAREAAIAEELGEAIAAAASHSGIDVAKGDRGARLAAALGGRREFNAEEFTARPDDSTVVRLGGQLVPAFARQYPTTLHVQFLSAKGFSLRMPVNGRTFSLKDSGRYDRDVTAGEILMQVNKGYSGKIDVVAPNGKVAGSIRVKNYGKVPNPVVALDHSQTHTLHWGPQGIVVKPKTATPKKSFVDIEALEDSSGKIDWRVERPDGSMTAGGAARDGGTGDLDGKKDGKIRINPGANKAIYVQVDKGQFEKSGDDDEFWRIETNAQGTYKRAERMVPLVVTDQQGLKQGGTIELYDAKGTRKWTSIDNQGRDWDINSDNPKFSALVRADFKGFVKVNGKRFEVKNGKVSAQETKLPSQGGFTMVRLDGNDRASQNIDTIFSGTTFEYRYTYPNSKQEFTVKLKPLPYGVPVEGVAPLQLPTGTSGKLTLFSMGEKDKLIDDERPLSDIDASQLNGRSEYIVNHVGKPNFEIDGTAVPNATRGEHNFRLVPPLTELQSQYITDFKLRKSELLAAGRGMLSALDLPESGTESVDRAFENTKRGLERLNNAKALLTEAYGKIKNSREDLKKAGVGLTWFLLEAKGLTEEMKALTTKLAEKLAAYANDYRARLRAADRMEDRARNEALLGLVGSVLGGFSGLADVGISARQIVVNGNIYKSRSYWYGKDADQKSGEAAAALFALRTRPSLTGEDKLAVERYVELHNKPDRDFPGKNDAERTDSKQRAMENEANRSGLSELQEIFAMEKKAVIARVKKRENDGKLENVYTDGTSFLLSFIPIPLDGASIDLFARRLDRLDSGGKGDTTQLPPEWETARQSVASLIETMREVVPWERIRTAGITEQRGKDKAAGPEVDGFAITRWRRPPRAQPWLEGFRF